MKRETSAGCKWLLFIGAVLTSNLLFPLLIGHSVCANQRSDLEQDGLVGKVNHVIIEIADASGRARKPHSSTRYDRHGRAVEQTIHNPDGSQTHTYNELGQPTQEVEHDIAGSVVSTTRYTFDTSGNIAEATTSDGNNTVFFRRSYRYSNEGRRVEIDTYGSGGAHFDGRDVEVRDGGGRLLERIKYGPQGRVNLKCLYEYDHKGRPVKTVMSNEALMFLRILTRWDDVNRIQETTTLKADGKIERRVVCNLNTRGVAIKCVTYGSDSSLDDIVSCRYDAQGGLIEEERSNSRGEIDYRWQYDYEYDRVGNWRKRTKLIWARKAGKSYFEPSEITDQSITYYDE